MEWHPASKIFPMLDNEALQELADDIKRNGLQQLILIDREDRVIDGRNRLAACQIAGVEPVFETHSDDSTIIETVISLNLRRRHLTSAQRAAAAAKADKLIEAEREAAAKRRKAGNAKGGKSVQKVVPTAKDTSALADHRISEQFGTNRQYVADARKIKEHDEKHDTSLIDQMSDGTMSISQAKKIVRESNGASKPKKSNNTQPKKPKPFDPKKAGDRLCDWLRAELDRWPEKYRGEAAHDIRQILEKEFNL